jgi:FAD/FMN-containing dehydrogenase
MTIVSQYTDGVIELAPVHVEELRAQLRGGLVLPGDAGYDKARTVWNAAVDKRPAMIARCADASDVVEAVKFARRHDILTSVRCGGHNIAGKAVADNGLMIDLTPICDVRVDPENKIAVVGGGAALGDLDRATQAFGLATTAGVVTHTGVGGLTLGGGVGRLARKFGLSCDNLKSVDVVTADGDQLTASEDDNADLFWALRGGGGNFGIATAFTFRLHEIGTEVLYAAATHRIEDAKDALRFLLDFAPAAPREVTSQAVLATMADGSAVVVIGACHIAPLDNAEAILAPLVRFGSPVATRLEKRPYLDVQSDADQRFPYGQNYYWKTHLIKELSQAAIDTIVECYATVPNSNSMIVFQQFGGAVRDIGAAETAFVNRDAEFDFIPAAVWHDERDAPALIDWVRRTWAAMKPFATGGVYLNNLGGEDDRLNEAVGANEARLREIKARYDPTNFFRLNANIIPAG